MDFQIPIGRDVNRPASILGLVVNKLKQWVLTEKMLNPFGLIVFFLMACGLSYKIVTADLKIGVFAIGAFAGPMFIVKVATDPKFGMLFYFICSWLLMLILRLNVISFPLGTVMDGLLVLMLLNYMMEQKKKPNPAMIKGPITKILVWWIVYHFMEVGNPAAASREAWMYTIRTIGVLPVCYFIFVFNIRTKEYMQKMLNVWYFFLLVAAWYAFKQEYFGFFQFEEDYLHSDPNIMLLLFLAGHWRKFSMLSDPVTFAYNMVAGAFLAIGMLTNPNLKPKQRYFFYFLIFSCFLNMMYSGTRGAFPLVPATLVIYAIMKFSRKIMIMVGIAGMFIVGLIFMPTSNQNILRFQTAFKPNKDASYIVRKINQSRIKPFIWSHPIGGGLGSVGEWGKKFSPGTYLANFPPDSGYVRTTVEAGPIGLLLLVLLMYNIMKTGINNYYAIKDPELKALCLGLLMIIFIFNIGNFPQEALVQYPSNVVFYLSAALIVVTRRLDEEMQLKNATDAKLT